MEAQNNNYSNECMNLYIDDNCTAPIGDWRHDMPWNCENVHHYYWGYYYPTNNIAQSEGRIEAAFRIMKKLMKLKLIKKDMTVANFIDVVHTISKEL